MARIRTVKPEFWTDEKIVQLPYEARLLFIGLWNFCDDDGFIAQEPERIRMQVLPGDTVDCDALLDLLVAIGILDRLVLIDGRRVLQIPSFPEHQKISHKTPTKLSLDGAKKQAIPNSVRREVAIKYGCKQGEQARAQCYYCGSEGLIYWWKLSNGKPSSWVSFSNLELDHFIPENSGGKTNGENIVLSCRYCNRSKGIIDGLEFSSKDFRKSPERSRSFAPEGKGREGSLREDSVPSERAPSATVKDEDRRLYERGKEVLGKSAGGVITDLRKHYGGAIHKTLAAIELAAGKETPMEYVQAILQNRPSNQFAETDTARMRRLMEEYEKLPLDGNDEHKRANGKANGFEDIGGVSQRALADPGNLSGGSRGGADGAPAGGSGKDNSRSPAEPKDDSARGGHRGDRNRPGT